MPSADPAVPYISIVVPAGSGRLPAFGEDVEVIAAESPNVGIRRARGEFILFTSADLTFSPELIAFLRSRRLEKRRLYRIDLREGNVLHAREGSFVLDAEGLRVNAAEDIAGAGSDVHFGEGWFPAEKDAGTGEVFRWIGADAEVIVRGAGALAIELEPGPGLGPLPQLLQVLDDAGAAAAQWTIAGRTSLRLWVPPGVRRFRLAALDGGRALLDDLRILNFRVFRCDWVRPASIVPREASHRPILMRLARSGGIAGLGRARRLLQSVGPDVFGAGIEYCGSGWHRLEESGAERFRWASSEAELVVGAVDGPQDLCLLVEPGPSLKGEAFQLAVRLADAAMIARVKVSGLTLARIPLPLAAGDVAKLFLSPDREGEALPGDSRVLNFRVLACACESSEKPAVPVKIAGWTASTVDAHPVGIDWTASLQGQRRELAEIGKPVFLHVNAPEFFLMDRQMWSELRGLPGMDGCLGALFCYSAHFAGAAEVVLREPLRLERTGPPPSRTAVDDDMIWQITQMRRLRTPAILTMDNWGVQ